MKSLKFKSDDEKHAWDMYAAGAASCPDAPASESAEYADALLLLRRERERPPFAGLRPRPGSGVLREP